MSSFEGKNSVFNIINENNSFSISIPGQLRILNLLEDNFIDELKNLLKLKSVSDNNLHVEEVRKRGNKIKKNSKEYSSSDFDRSKEEILEELKKFYHDLEDLVYRMQLTYDEIIDILDIKNNPTRRTSYTLPVGVYEVSDIDWMFKSLLPNNVKVSVTIDNIRLKSNLKIFQTSIFTNESLV